MIILMGEVKRKSEKKKDRKRKKVSLSSFIMTFDSSKIEGKTLQNLAILGFKKVILFKCIQKLNIFPLTLNLQAQITHNFLLVLKRGTVSVKIRWI